MEQIDAYLNIVRSLNPLPPSCVATASQVYPILDALLARYAKTYFISERVGYVLRRGLTFFPMQALQPVLQPLLDRMNSAFESSGYPSYVWIIGKCAAKFANAARGPMGAEVAGILARSFEQLTLGVGKLLQGTTAIELPDGECLWASVTLGFQI